MEENKEIYNLLNIECAKAIADYFIGINSILDNNDLCVKFNNDWVIKYLFLFKRVIIKPKGLPYIFRSINVEFYFTREFYKLYKKSNTGIVSDEDLDKNNV